MDNHWYPLQWTQNVLRQNLLCFLSVLFVTNQIELITVNCHQTRPRCVGFNLSRINTYNTTLIFTSEMGFIVSNTKHTFHCHSSKSELIASGVMLLGNKTSRVQLEINITFHAQENVDLNTSMSCSKYNESHLFCFLTLSALAYRNYDLVWQKRDKEMVFPNETADVSGLSKTLPIVFNVQSRNHPLHIAAVSSNNTSKVLVETILFRTLNATLLIKERADLVDLAPNIKNDSKVTNYYEDMNMKVGMYLFYATLLMICLWTGVSSYRTDLKLNKLIWDLRTPVESDTYHLKITFGLKIDPATKSNIQCVAYGNGELSHCVELPTEYIGLDSGPCCVHYLISIPKQVGSVWFLALRLQEDALLLSLIGLQMYDLRSGDTFYGTCVDSVEVGLKSSKASLLSDSSGVHLFMLRKVEYCPAFLDRMTTHLFQNCKITAWRWSCSNFIYRRFIKFYDIIEVIGLMFTVFYFLQFGHVITMKEKTDKFPRNTRFLSTSVDYIYSSLLLASVTHFTFIAFKFVVSPLLPRCTQGNTRKSNTIDSIIISYATLISSYERSHNDSYKSRRDENNIELEGNQSISISSNETGCRLVEGRRISLKLPSLIEIKWWLEWLLSFALIMVSPLVFLVTKQNEKQREFLGFVSILGSALFHYFLLIDPLWVLISRIVVQKWFFLKTCFWVKYRNKNRVIGKKTVQEPQEIKCRTEDGKSFRLLTRLFDDIRHYHYKVKEKDMHNTSQERTFLSRVLKKSGTIMYLSVMICHLTFLLILTKWTVDDHSLQVWKAMNRIFRIQVLQKPQHDPVHNFWDWSQSTLEFILDKKGMDYTIQSYFVLGNQITIVQKRIKPETCQVPPPMNKLRIDCNSNYQRRNEDTAPYLRGWKSAPEFNMTEWSYNENIAFNTEYLYFKSGTTYGKGGYTIILDKNNASESIQKLRSSLWIDQYTRMVALEVVFYNPSLNIFVPATITIEYTPSSKVFINPRFHAHVLFYEFKPGFGVIRFSEWLYLVGSIFLLGYNLHCKIGKTNAFGGWFLLEFIVSVLALITVEVFLMKNDHISSVFGRPFDISDQQNQLNLISLYQDILEHILALLTFISSFLLIKPAVRMRFLRDFGNVLILSVKAWQGIAMEIAVLFTAFACWGHFLFGAIIVPFSSLDRSYPTVFELLITPQRYSEKFFSVQIYGFLYFSIYTVLMLFIVTNIFTSVVHTTYRVTRHQRYLIKMYKKNSSTDPLTTVSSDPKDFNSQEPAVTRGIDNLGFHTSDPLHEEDDFISPKEATEVNNRFSASDLPENDSQDDNSIEISLTEGSSTINLAGASKFYYNVSGDQESAKKAADWTESQTSVLNINHSSSKDVLGSMLSPSRSQEFLLSLELKPQSFKDDYPRLEMEKFGWTAVAKKATIFQQLHKLEFILENCDKLDCQMDVITLRHIPHLRSKAQRKLVIKIATLEVMLL